MLLADVIIKWFTWATFNLADPVKNRIENVHFSDKLETNPFNSAQGIGFLRPCFGFFRWWILMWNSYCETFNHVQENCYLKFFFIYMHRFDRWLKTWRAPKNKTKAKSMHQILQWLNSNFWDDIKWETVLLGAIRCLWNFPLFLFHC